MNETRARRIRFALLPLGVAFAVLVLARLVLLFSGVMPAEPLGTALTLMAGISALLLIWVGRDLRRVASRGG
jgi:hypothetical protein